MYHDIYHNEYPAALNLEPDIIKKEHFSSQQRKDYYLYLCRGIQDRNVLWLEIQLKCYLSKTMKTMLFWSFMN